MKSQAKLAQRKPTALSEPVVAIDEASQVVVLGKIGTSYGLQGWLKIQSYTYPLENLLDYDDYLVGDHTRWHQFTLTEGKPHGKGVVAHFQGYDTPEMARQLTNRLIAVRREALAETEDGEYYWHDLIGLDVINLDQQSLGKVVELLDTGPHDILVIRNDAEADGSVAETLIPYVTGKFVQSVNLADNTIIVDWQPDSFTYK